MATTLEDRLSASDFDTNHYIKDVAFKYDSSDELHRHKRQIQGVADRTAQKLKHNVYNNYALFIDTSREISSLEAEMYQLSHMLHEHQVLTASIQRLGVEVGEPTFNLHESSSEPQEKYSIASLLETVEGCSAVTEVPGRYLIHSSELLELDSHTYDLIQSVRAFLLNDSLMLAVPIKAKRRGPVKYQFQALYELDNLAIVNIKDHDRIKFVFEIKMFPDSHMFQAESETIKKHWIELLEGTKQRHNAERVAMKNIERANLACRRGRKLERQPTEVIAPGWLIKDAPENLDVYIAQREVEKAVDLIEKAKLHIKEASDTTALRDIRVRINHRTNLLSEVLMRELQTSQSGSLRGGPRAARRAIGFLIRLGRAAKACELFLQNHSRIIDHELKQIKMEGATTIYIRNVSQAFFSSLEGAATEFERAFGENSGSYSAFVTWCIKELKEFLKNYCIENIFQPIKTSFSFSAVADCVSTICSECDTLQESGLDLTSQVMQILHPHIVHAIQEARVSLEEKLSTIGASDSWEPIDCRNNQAQVAQIILQLTTIGVPSPANLITDNIVDLSQTTFTSCQNIFSLVESFLKIQTSEILESFVDALGDIFRHVTVNIIGDLLFTEGFHDKTDFLLMNADLLINSTIPALTMKIEGCIGRQVPDMTKLHKELQDFMELKENARKKELSRSSREGSAKEYEGTESSDNDDEEDGEDDDEDDEDDEETDSDDDDDDDDDDEDDDDEIV